jgi:precorrin-6B methylase 2
MRKKIILDTDVFADIGDIGAIAVACALHKPRCAVVACKRQRNQKPLETQNSLKISG